MNRNSSFYLVIKIIEDKIMHLFNYSRFFLPPPPLTLLFVIMSALHTLISNPTALTKLRTLIKTAKSKTDNTPVAPHCVHYEDVWPWFYAKKHSSRRKLVQLQENDVDNFQEQVKASKKTASHGAVKHEYHLTLAGFEIFLKSIDSERARQVHAMCKEALQPVGAQTRTPNSLASFLEKGKRKQGSGLPASAARGKRTATCAELQDATAVVKRQLNCVGEPQHELLDMVERQFALSKQVMASNFFKTAEERKEFCRTCIFGLNG